MNYDVSIPGQLMSALGPDLLLMGGAMILLLWSAWKPESETLQRNIGVTSIVLCVTVIVAIAFYVANGDRALPGIIAVDNFRWTADVVFLIATIGTIALSMDYNAREGITAAESHGPSRDSISCGTALPTTRTSRDDGMSGIACAHLHLFSRRAVALCPPTSATR